MPRSVLRQGWLAAALVGLAFAHSDAISLDAALEATLEKNPAISQARLALEQAAGQRLVLRSSGLPVARLQGLAGVQGGKRAGEPDTQPFGIARGFFNQPLFDAAIPASFRKGDVEILIAQQRLNMAVVEQLHATRIAFYGALLNKALAELGEAQHERLTENVKTQQDRYEAGQADRGSVSSARVLEQELDPRIQEVQRQYQTAVLTMATLMGHNVGPNAKLPEPEGELTLTPVHYNVPAEIASALKRRPDLELARLLVRAAKEDQRIIEAAYYPFLEGTIAGTYVPTTIRRASGGSATRTDDIISSEIIPGIASTWRVVDNGRVGGQVLRADAIRQMNNVSLQQLESNVSIELKRISNNLGAIEKRWSSLSAAVASAEQNVIAIQQSLTEGLSSQLEFRTAESSFLETKGVLLSTVYQHNVALAEWDQATGRYFQFSRDRPSISH